MDSGFDRNLTTKNLSSAVFFVNLSAALQQTDQHGASMHVNRIDHLVLTVADIERTAEFYCRVLGMQRIEFAGGRVGLSFGTQKINLHQSGAEFEPKAKRVQPGSADLCFIVDIPIEQAINHISRSGIDIIEGPVPRSGASGPIVSAYLRDPDGNLLEISNYTDGGG